MTRSIRSRARWWIWKRSSSAGRCSRWTDRTSESTTATRRRRLRPSSARPGKDVVVYGGATFVGSLIDSTLIDELNFFYNPVAIGDGLRIFSKKTKLNHVGSTSYASGIVVSTYRPG